MRKSYPDTFKFKVALSACCNNSTIAELSQKFDGVAPSLNHKWKSHLKAHGAQVFEKVPFKGIESGHERELQQLYEKIGRLNAERDYLKKMPMV